MTDRTIAWLLRHCQESIAAVKAAMELPPGPERDELIQDHIADLMTAFFTAEDHSGSNPELDSLVGDGDKPIAAFNKRLASAYGAREARIVVGGSSIINVTVGGFVLPSLLQPGRRKVLIDRDAHLSMIGGMAVGGLEVVWLHRDYDPRHDVQKPVSVRQVREALDADPGIGAVSVTSPTYDGFSVNIEGLAKVCRSRGVLLIVDGAWGPCHGLLTDVGFPPSPIERGADIAGFSLHKKGLAPSSVAVVAFRAAEHARLYDVGGNVGLATTSPNYLLLGVAEWMLHRVLTGQCNSDWALVPEAAARFGSRVAEAHPAYRVISAADVGAETGDPGHVLVHVGGAGVNGYDVQAALAGMGFDAEKATRSTLLFLVGPLEARDIDAWTPLLKQATAQVIAARGDAVENAQLQIPPSQRDCVMTIRSAMLAPSEAVDLATAQGRTAAAVVAVYPPGSALLAPGERIEPIHVEYLRAVASQGGRIRGLEAEGTRIRVLIEPSAHSDQQN